MTRWVRYDRGGTIGFGILGDDATITPFQGDMFAGPEQAGPAFALSDVRILTPCVPSKMPALWNNYKALSAKLGTEHPPHPLYFLKAPSSYTGTGEIIKRPAGYDGRVIYEGELGIVIGKRARGISESDADAHIFGYTCINDVTAVDLLKADASFDQWTRAKSFDGFGVFGPCIATGLDPDGLVIRTVLNGAERQNYPAGDMIIGPRRIVSLLSHDMTLEPGDVICCGTSLGAGTMKEPVNTVEINIEGIGSLTNVYEN